MFWSLALPYLNTFIQELELVTVMGAVSMSFLTLLLFWMFLALLLLRGRWFDWVGDTREEVIHIDGVIIYLDLFIDFRVTVS